MPTHSWPMSTILGLLLLGLASTTTAQTPQLPDARQELAPTGHLRVALQQGSPLHLTEDPTSGELTGVGLELGQALARRIEVPFEPVPYPSIGTLRAAGRSGEWDVAFVRLSPEWAAEFDFTGRHLEVEFGYLIPAGSVIATMAEVDQPGVRIAVPENEGPDFFLRTLEHAVVVRAASIPDTVDALNAGSADVIGGPKPLLFEMANALPGSRVLDGRPGIIAHAMAMPRGRDDLGVAYALQFIEDAKAEGLVQAAIERAGVSGVVVAPPQ
jgi:polar amino acid transport system substrate-binding protein